MTKFTRLFGLGVWVAVSAHASEPIAPITGAIVSPSNQTDLGVSVAVRDSICEEEGQWYVEITYPTRFLNEPARAARFRLTSPQGGVELWLDQNQLNGQTAYTDFCGDPKALDRAELMLIYGGAGTKANIKIGQFGRWFEKR